MHAAICLSGNFRDYKRTLKTLFNIIKQFDKCDIFMIYDITEKKEDIESIKKLLKPVAFKAVKSLDDCNNMNMWYKIQESYKICKDYYTKKNIKYDIIIRARYDIIYYNKFDFKNIKIKEDTLYVGTAKNKLFYYCQKILLFIKKFLLEEFFFGSPKVMENHMNFFNLISISKNKCLKYRLSEIDFYIYSNLLMTKIVTLPIFYETFMWKDDFFGYSYKKYKKYPSWGLSFILNRFIILLLITLVLLFLYVNKDSCKFLK